MRVKRARAWRSCLQCGVACKLRYCTECRPSIRKGQRSEGYRTLGSLMSPGRREQRLHYGMRALSYEHGTQQPSYVRRDHIPNTLRAAPTALAGLETRSNVHRHEPEARTCCVLYADQIVRWAEHRLAVQAVSIQMLRDVLAYYLKQEGGAP